MLRVPLLLPGLTACIGVSERPAPSAPQRETPGAAATGARFSWPNGALAAVSLTYDDAIPTDLDVARPALDRHGLRATFFLTGSSPEVAKRADEWKALGRQGHELASHTMFHPCDRSFAWVKRGFALQDYDLDRMDRELQDSLALLRTLGAERGPYTFAYPCGSTWIGEGRTSYVGLTEKYFLASRGLGGTVADPRTDPLASIPAVSGDGKSGAELIAMVRAAVERSGWLVLVFHGVGGDYLTVDAGAHDALLAYLDANRSTVWTDTFGAVAARIAAQRGQL
ncbi:MAG TPA: polysaccharide deacetylase family protein [Polyangiaceae bacterium]|nr:polysaccharide deacetylase family protein [Polyangiaceae bacterium]